MKNKTTKSICHCKLRYFLHHVPTVKALGKIFKVCIKYQPSGHVICSDCGLFA